MGSIHRFRVPDHAECGIAYACFEHRLQQVGGIARRTAPWIVGMVCNHHRAQGRRLRHCQCQGLGWANRRTLVTANGGEEVVGQTLRKVGRQCRLVVGHDYDGSTKPRVVSTEEPM